MSRLPVINRIQEDGCAPEVAAALEIVRKEVKDRDLRRNGKRPLRGGEAGLDDIETAIIQALAPLQNTQDCGAIISKTNDYKQTLAHFAVLFGYTNLLRRLMGWNIDLTIADVNGFTALHCAYNKGDRALVDLLLENGASETVLDALGRAPSHLMPEGFASLSDHDTDKASDDQLELEQRRDVLSLFQSTDSWHGAPDSGEEKSMNKAGFADLMHQSPSSNTASNNQSTLRSPLPIAPTHPPLSLASLARHDMINASSGPMVEADQPSGTPGTPPNDPLYSLQPASTDTWPFQGGRFDECLPDPSAPSQGTFRGPGMFQGNCLPIPSSQSSMPRGNGETANL